MNLKRTQLLLVALFSLFIACTGPQGPTGATGPEGPAGPTGPGGPQGPIGNANVKTFRFTNLSGKWTTPAEALGYTHSIKLNLPITDDEATSLYNAGAILVYAQDFNSYRWWALPTYLNDSDITFQQDRGSVIAYKTIALSGRLRSGSGTPTNLTDVKVILIFSTQQGNPIGLGASPSSRAQRLIPQLKDVNLSDYAAVAKVLGLSE